MQINTKIVSCHTADSKPVKQEVNGTAILPPLDFPALILGLQVKGATTEPPGPNQLYGQLFESNSLVGSEHSLHLLIAKKVAAFDRQN